MTDRDIERKLNTALEHSAPNDIAGVLSRCGEQKGRVIDMTNSKKKNRLLPALIAACLTLVILGGGFWGYRSNAVASIISLDVNPSIELNISRSEKVLSAKALNADAATVLKGMDLNGSDLNVAVNAIIGSLLQNGYFDSLSSAILISVEDSDAQRAQRLESSLTTQVDTALKNASTNTAILSQTIAQDAGLEKKAQESSISVGKAALVTAIQERNTALEFNALASLSVGELEDLRKADSPAMPIGKDKAAAIAEEYAGTTALSSVYTEVDSELDERTPHYEVELNAPFGEFEYKIDAYTGEVLRGKANIVPDAPTPAPVTPDPKPTVPDPKPSQSPADPAPTPPSSPSSGVIGRDAALSAALSHAGISLSDARDIEVDAELDERTPHYDVDFSFGKTEYEYEIDAHSGAVLSHEKERND